MEKESQLRLRLTAQNDAGPAFLGVTESVKALQTSLAEASKSAREAFDSIAQSARTSTEGISSSMNASKEAFTSEGNAAKETAESVARSMQSVKESLDSAATSARTASEGIASSLTGSKEAFSSEGTTAKETAESIARSMQSVKESMESSATSARTASEGVVSSLTGSKEAFTSESTTAKEMSESIATSMRSVETAISSVTMAVRQQTTDIKESFGSMASSSKQSSEEMTGALDKIGGMIGLQMIGDEMKHIGEAGLHMFESAIHSAAEFEGSMSRVHAVLMNREPTANMHSMSEAALKLGANSKFSANEIATGMYDLARQGLSSSQILGDGINGAINVVNNLAQSVDGDMGETAKVITDVMHEFGLSGAELAHVGDMISGTMHTSSITMNDFYYSMRQIGPVASNMHQSIDDVSTAIALLAQHGISGSSAGTAVKNMLLGLEPHTKKAAALMHDLGISAKDGAADSFYKLNGDLKPMPNIIGILHDKFGGLNDKLKEQALAATFTKYGLAGLNTIVMEGKDKFEELKHTLSEEKSADIAREKLNNLQGDMLRLNAATETMKKSFGDTLAPALRVVAQEAQKLVNWFTDLSPHMKETIMIVGGVASALLILAGTLTTVAIGLAFAEPGFKLMSVGLTVVRTGVIALMGPWGIAIAAIVAGVVLLIANWDSINAWVKEHFGITIPEIWQSLKDTASRIFDSIAKIFSDVWANIKEVTMDAWNYISPTIIGAVTRISDFWNEVWPRIKELFTQEWEYMRAFLSPILSVLYDIIAAALHTITGLWKDVWNVIKDALKLVWDLIVDVLRLGWDVITGIFKIALDILTGHWSDAWNEMVKMLKNIWEDIKRLFGDFAANSAQFGKDFIMGLVHGIEGAMDFAITAAKRVVSAITSIFSSAPKSPTVQSAPAATSSNYSYDGISAFAKGGVVDKPTLALIGEGGEREYIIPESKLRGQDGYSVGLPESYAFGGGNQRGGSVVIHVGGITVNGAGKDGQQIGMDVMSILRNQMSFAL